MSVQPRQRKGRINYSENEFIKASLKATKEDKVKGPRLTKMPALQDFQFFDMVRIEELYSIEHMHETWKFQQAHKKAELERQGASAEDMADALNGPERCAGTYLFPTCFWFLVIPGISQASTQVMFPIIISI